MKGQRLVFEMPDGTIRVGKCFTDDHEDFAAKVLLNPEMAGAKQLPDMKDDERPSREFRNAWRANPDGTIRVDDLLIQQIIEERAKLSIEDRLAKLEASNETQI